MFCKLASRNTKKIKKEGNDCARAVRIEILIDISYSGIVDVFMCR